MATKPTIADARWGETAGGTPGLVVAPNSGQRDSGWTLNQIGISTIDNYIKRQFYLWMKYLSDGALTGNHTITGTLNVSGLVTADAGVTCGANQNVIVSGTGKYRRGSKIRRFSVTRKTYSVGTLGDGVWTSSAPGQSIQLPLDGFEEGERITAVSVRVDPAGAAAMSFSIFKRVDGGSGSPSQFDSNPSSGTALQTITASGMTEVISAATLAIYELRITAGQSGDAVYSISVTTDVPA